MVTACIPLTLSLTNCPYKPLIKVSFLEGAQCQYTADECKFLPVSQHWCAYVYESIEECHMSLSLFLQLRLACLSHLTWMIYEMGGK